MEPAHEAVSVRRVMLLMAAIAGLMAPAAADDITELPQGPGRDLVSKVCRSCHDLKMVFDAAGFSRADWDVSLDEMTANGMDVSAADRAEILDYLSTYLGPSRPPDAPSLSGGSRGGC
jgi:cytochrome c5